MAEARKVLELSPQYPAARTLLAFDHLALGNIDNAITEAKLEPDEFWRSQGLAILYRAAGRTLDSDQALQKIIEKYSDEGPFQMPKCMHSGRSRPCVQWLETAYDSGSWRDANPG
jgi:hypothetical protein